MSNKLTYSEATLGWRFSHTDRFLKHFEGQIDLLQDLVINNLDHYWNIDEAKGVWLDKIGEIFGLKRPYGMSGTQFVLDVDRLDDPDVVLDGEATAVSDIMFRTLIKARNLQPGKLFCMRSIKETFEFLFGVGNVKVDFIENLDIHEEERPMYFRIKVTFKNPTDAKGFIGLQELNPFLLLGKPMAVSYDIYYEVDENM